MDMWEHARNVENTSLRRVFSSCLECSQMSRVFYHSVIHSLGFFINKYRSLDCALFCCKLAGSRRVRKKCRENTRRSRVFSPTFWVQLLYNRTEHSRGFFIFMIKNSMFSPRIRIRIRIRSLEEREMLWEHGAVKIRLWAQDFYHA